MRERLIVPRVAVVVLLLLGQLVALHAFQGPSTRTLLGKQQLPPAIPCSLHPTTTVASPAAAASRLSCRLCSKKSNNSNNGEENSSSSSGPEEYRNAATKILSTFMSSPSPDNQERSDSQPQTNDDDDDDVVFSRIDWDAPKIGKVPLETLAQALDAELYASEWFVTGRVNPRYFSDLFRFQDPDVKVTGIRAYAQGVRKIFNQPTCRAEIISTTVAASTNNNNNNTNTITCTWRLSGKVDIGPGLTIKPYIVYTDFTIDAETGLIVFQEDRFDLPGWDILLSAFFPFLIGKLTADPAPAPEPRNPPPTVPAGVLSSDNGNTGKRTGNFFPWFK